MPPRVRVVSLATGGGHLSLRGVYGPTTARTGGGNIKVDAAAGASLTLDSGGGNVEVRGGGFGELAVHTGGGNVGVQAGRLEKLQLHTGGGNLTAALALGDGGECHCETGAGNVLSSCPATRPRSGGGHWHGAGSATGRWCGWGGRGRWALGASAW